ncbi:MAG: hypothetical protein GPOALKHO_001917 [Sodalis sp.]|nr:MAG: hypothetical protein GPOALKHO_001917 [Sodalis sp.]
MPGHAADIGDFNVPMAPTADCRGNFARVSGGMQGQREQRTLSRAHAGWAEHAFAARLELYQQRESRKVKTRSGPTRRSDASAPTAGQGKPSDTEPIASSSVNGTSGKSYISVLCKNSTSISMSAPLKIKRPAGGSGAELRLG